MARSPLSTLSGLAPWRAARMKTTADCQRLSIIGDGGGQRRGSQSTAKSGERLINVENKLHRMIRRAEAASWAEHISACESPSSFMS